MAKVLRGLLTEVKDLESTAKDETIEGGLSN